MILKQPGYKLIRGIVFFTLLTSLFTGTACAGIILLMKEFNWFTLVCSFVAIIAIIPAGARTFYLERKYFKLYECSAPHHLLSKKDYCGECGIRGDEIF